MSLTIPAALEPVLGNIYPHRPRVLYILKKRADVNDTDFAAALHAWRCQWPVEIGFGSVVVRAGAAMMDQQEVISGRFRAGGIEVSPYDGYVSLDLECYAPTATDFERLFDLAKGCLHSLEGVIDKAATIAFGGVTNMVIPGNGPLTMILVLDRVDGLSLEDYNAWWVHHSDDHRRFNPAQLGYNQLHNAPEFNALAAQAAGVTTTTLCVVDIMYLADVHDGFPKPGGRSAEDARAMSVEIGTHVSFATVCGSYFNEL